MSKFINAFKTFPLELFRVNNGRAIKLREWAPQKISYDILTQHGYAKAKALDPATYTGKVVYNQIYELRLTLNVAPNGASMRPNSQFQRKMIAGFPGRQVVVYSIPAGTRLPDDLVLVHEYQDHFSLQAAKDMPLQELNGKLTDFLEAYGNVRAKEAWLQAYSPATF